MDKRFPIEDQIEMLRSFVRGSVITPESCDYDSVRQLAHLNFDGRPLAVIRVANANDVATIVNFAVATDLPLSVRAGGHSTAGHSVNNGGLVIDLRNLRGVEIDEVAQLGWFGAGLTAGEIIAAIEPRGLVIGFGDSASVGAAGLTLGGGIGYLTRKLGLTHDSLVAAEIVTADGDVRVIDADHEPDLFWAIRGGGGNFGIVTRLCYRLHPLPELIGGPLILPATPEVISGFVTAADHAPDELTAIALVMPAPPLPFIPAELHGRIVVMAMMAYAGGADAAARALAPFRELAAPLADLVGPLPYSALFIPEPPGLRLACAVRTTYVPAISLSEAERLIAALERGDAPMRMAQIRVLGGVLSRMAPDATAYAHRDQAALVAVLSLSPEADSADRRQERWVEDSIAIFGESGRGGYVNFLANEGTERVHAVYPGAFWDRLRAIKAKYDPDNLFRANQNIPPARLADQRAAE